MKENSKHINILITALICLLVIVCPVFLRPVKPSPEEKPAKTAPDSVGIYHPQLTHEESPSSPSAPLNYTVKLEDGTLNFYLNSENGIILLESSQINTALLPKDDITALTRGITADTLEEGIGIIEDFTS